MAIDLPALGSTSTRLYFLRQGFKNAAFRESIPPDGLESFAQYPSVTKKFPLDDFSIYSTSKPDTCPAGISFENSSEAIWMMFSIP
jgi:hypothetical protein